VRKSRKNYTGPEKMAILRRHLVDRVAVSELCEEHQLQPSLFYHWQKKLFENGAVAFEIGRRKPAKAQAADARRIAALEAKLQTKNEVLAELMEEHVALKKALGEP
jgi:transposase